MGLRRWRCKGGIGDGDKEGLIWDFRRLGNVLLL